MIKNIKIAVFNFSSVAGGSSTVANTLVKIYGQCCEVVRFSVYGESVRKFKLNRLLHRIDNLLSLIFFFSYRNISLNIIPTSNAKFVNRLSAHVIHFHWVHFNFFSFWDIAKIRKPIVWTLHDSWIVNEFQHLDTGKVRLFPRLINRINRAKLTCLQQANLHLVCPSQWLFNKVTATGYFPVSKIYQVYNPVDMDFWKNEKYLRTFEFVNSEEEINLLFVSNEKLENVNKGFSMLLKIAAKALTKRITIKFNVVSPLPETVQTDISEAFIFHGKKNAEDLQKMYCKTDMVIMSSLSENLPTVLIEALACSCPVVAYKTGGIPEIVSDGENGKLVTSYESDDFLDAILEVKTNLAGYKLKTRKSVVAKFDYDSAKKAYFDIFKKLHDDIGCDSSQE